MKQQDYRTNIRLLSRDILTTCWFIIAVYLSGTSLNLLITTNDRVLFFQEVILKPGLQMIVLWSTAELLWRRSSRHIEHIVVAAVNLLICIMVISLYELPISIYMLIFPVMISLFYYRQSLIVFAVMQAFVSLAALYMLSSGLRSLLTGSDLIMVTAMISSTALIIMKLRKTAAAVGMELVRVSREKQELETINAVMQRLNRVDAATELYNHMAFHEQLERVVLAERNKPAAVNLAIMDIDNFKQVNDTFGHAAGDKVIRYVADNIRACIGPSDFASRYGGEEFAVISTELSTEQFCGMLERLRQAVNGSPRPELDGRKVSISIGVQQLQPGMTKDELFQHADAALYDAKRTGKNRLVLRHAAR